MTHVYNVRINKPIFFWVFAVSVQEQVYLVNEVANLMSREQNVPIFISKPNMLDCEADWREKITGMQPSDADDTLLDVEPYTGYCTVHHQHFCACVRACVLYVCVVCGKQRIWTYIYRCLQRWTLPSSCRSTYIFRVQPVFWTFSIRILLRI